MPPGCMLSSSMCSAVLLWLAWRADAADLYRACILGAYAYTSSLERLNGVSELRRINRGGVLDTLLNA